MYLLGHVGISLLLYAPIAAALLPTSPLLATVTGVVMVGLAPLPDCDTRTDRLAHRGPTHTVWFAFGVGLVVAALAGVTAVVPGSDPGGLLPTPLWAAGLLGGVSTLAILGHLAGDLITPMGLWPFRPLSEWHCTVDLTPSKSPRANRLCFGAGVVVLITALLATGDETPISAVFVVCSIG